MCGIAGYIGDELCQEIGMSMVRQIRHRGPDHQEARVYEAQVNAIERSRFYSQEHIINMWEELFRKTIK